MRGKTNVGGGSGISINAEVQDMIIQSGQIAAGDFVEHYTTDDYIAQENTLFFEFEINGYMIFRDSNAMTIAAYKNGQKVALYSDYSIFAIGRYENFIIFTTGMQKACGVLTIENDTFTLVDIVSAAVDYSAFYNICGGNGKIVCYATFEIDSQSKFYFCVANISSSGILSEFTLTVISKEFTSYGGNTIFYYNGSFKILFASGSSSSNYRSTLAEIFIDSNNNVTIGEDITTVGYRKTLLQKGNKIILAEPIRVESTAISSGSYYYSRIHVLNLETYRATTMTLPDNGEVLSNINDDGYFIATGKILVPCAWRSGGEEYIANKLRLCKYNENTGLISIEDEIVLPDDYSTSEQDITNVYTYFLPRVNNQSGVYYNKSIAGIDANNINIYAQIISRVYYTPNSSSPSLRVRYTDDKNLYLYNIIDGGIEKHPCEGYVLPYNSGHPIGVAKDAGIAGDTIGVYVPVASS